MSDNRTTNSEPPRIAEYRGLCGVGAQFALSVMTSGPIQAKHLRNVIRTLELCAEFLAEDEARQEEAVNAETK